MEAPSAQNKDAHWHQPKCKQNFGPIYITYISAQCVQNVTMKVFRKKKKKAQVQKLSTTTKKVCKNFTLAPL